MTITQRLVKSRPLTMQMKPDELPREQALDRVAAVQMFGILEQLGALSEYAGEILENLYNEVSHVGGRVRALKTRVGSLQSAVPKVEQAFSGNTDKLYSINKDDTKEWRRPFSITDNHFKPASQTIAMRNARNEAQAAPPLSNLDPYSTDGPCMLKYSNPQFFFEKWLQSELERQEQQKAAKSKRKAKRRKKKKDTSTAPTVKTITKTVYLADGTKQKVVVNAQSGRPLERTPSGIQTQPSAQQPSQHLAQPQRTHKQASISASVAPPPPPLPPTFGSPALGAPPAPPAPPAVGLPPAPPAPMGMHPPAPPPPPSMGGAPPPPMPPPTPAMGGPPPPPVPQAPVAPPIPNAPAPPVAPIAPPVPAVAANRPAPSSGMSLMDQIRGGTSLKKAAPAPPKPVDSARGGLLDAIKHRQFALRKVQQEEKQRDAPPAGGLSSIMAVLARRQAIEGSDDDDDDEDDWSD